MKPIILGLFAAASLSTAVADSVSANAIVTCNGVPVMFSCVSPDGLHYASANGSVSGTLDSSSFSLSLAVNANAMAGGSATVPVSGPFSISSLAAFSFDVQAIGSGPGTVMFQYGGGSDGSGGGGGIASIELLGLSASCTRIICNGMQSTGVTLGQPFEISLSGASSAGCFGVICTDGGVDMEATITVKDQFGSVVALAILTPEPGTTSFTLGGVAVGWLYFRRRKGNPRNP